MVIRAALDSGQADARRRKTVDECLHGEGDAQVASGVRKGGSQQALSGHLSPIFDAGSATEAFDSIDEDAASQARAGTAYFIQYDAEQAVNTWVQWYTDVMMQVL